MHTKIFCSLIFLLNTNLAESFATTYNNNQTNSQLITNMYNYMNLQEGRIKGLLAEHKSSSEQHKEQIHNITAKHEKGIKEQKEEIKGYKKEVSDYREEVKELNNRTIFTEFVKHVASIGAAFGYKVGR